MEWTVKISGEGFILREWANAIPSAEFSISLDGDEFVLKSPFIDAINDPNAARDKAEEILHSVNGVSRLKLGSQEPVKIVHLKSIADDG